MHLNEMTPDWRRTCIISLFCLLEEDLNGYHLKQRLEQWHVLEHIAVSPATIYKALGVLETEGLLESRVVKKGKYPPSTVFTINEKGRAFYEELLEEEANFTRTEFSEHIFVGMCAFLAVPERIRLARKRKEQARRHLKPLQQSLDEYGKMKGKPYAEWLLLDHEIHMVKAQIAWLDHFIDLLEND